MEEEEAPPSAQHKRQEAVPRHQPDAASSRAPVARPTKPVTKPVDVPDAFVAAPAPVPPLPVEVPIVPVFDVVAKNDANKRAVLKRSAVSATLVDLNLDVSFKVRAASGLGGCARLKRRRAGHL